jgi:hypothetical protein
MKGEWKNEVGEKGWNVNLIFRILAKILFAKVYFSFRIIAYHRIPAAAVQVKYT